MIDILDVSIVDLLPESVKNDPTMRAFALTLDEQLLKPKKDIYKLRRLTRMDDLDSDEANDLAYQLHVDFYDPALPLETRIELVKNSINFHRIKGTPAAVEQLIDILFGDGVVEEWFQYDGIPGHYRVKTSNPQATRDRVEEFYRAIESVTRFTAHLDSVVLEQTEEMALFFGNGLHMRDIMTVRMV
ncbi:phage tail protein [Paenibacillus kribbensis]|uniref:phage tail protein n=1 Tax=Paenibacillus kribbensis TaxID=172713 RepID=UPI002DC007EA|nr:phage tail protein [Paenibacillus kribbensis]MEC0234084.1 phage tail protein [Paenibacillus kribbensis]